MLNRYLLHNVQASSPPPPLFKSSMETFAKKIENIVFFANNFFFKNINSICVKLSFGTFKKFSFFGPATEDADSTYLYVKLLNSFAIPVLPCHNV